MENKALQLSAIRLRELLNEKCMSAQELSNKSGVSKASLSQYLSGKYTPKNTSAKKLADVLKVNPAWLMGLDVSKEEKIQTKRDDFENYLKSKIESTDNFNKQISFALLEKCVEELDIDKLEELGAFVEYQKIKKKNQLLSIISLIVAITSIIFTIKPLY